MSRLSKMYDYDGIDEIVEFFFDNLIFQKPIKKFLPSATCVYPVSSKGKSCILKLSHKEHRYGFEHIKQEAKTLRYLKGFSGVPLLMEEYDLDSYVAILKEFKEGYFIFREGNDINPEEGGLSYHEIDGLVDSFKDTISSFHNMGVVRLDVSGTNLIYDERDDLLTLVDLGTARFRSEMDEGEYEHHLQQDYEDLRELVTSKKRHRYNPNFSC